MRHQRHRHLQTSCLRSSGNLQGKAKIRAGVRLGNGFQVLLYSVLIVGVPQARRRNLMCNFPSMTKQTIFMKIKTTTKLDSEDRKKPIRSCKTKLYKKKKGTENPLSNSKKHKIDSFWNFFFKHLHPFFIFIFFFFCFFLFFFNCTYRGGVCVYNH